MARKEVRKIDFNLVPRQWWETDGLPHGPQIRVLNQCDETGARTLIVDIPFGWENPVPHWHSCEEEFYVLDGDLTVGDASYRKGHYVFRPAGQVHGPTRSENGCTLVYWHESAFDVQTGDPPPSEGVAKPFVEVDTDLPRDQWHLLPVEGLPMPIGMIRMRHAEDTGCDNTFEWVPPGFKSIAREFHTADEESLTLEGWSGPDARIGNRAGAYAYRPAGQLHGPSRHWDAKIIVKHYGPHETVLFPKGLKLYEPEWELTDPQP